MNQKNRDVAIVGMSALFPGAGSLAQYWQNIVDGKCSITEAPDSWSYPYYDPDSDDNGRIYTRKGGFIGDLTDFNPAEFGIMPNAIEGSDPDGFLVLRLAREALADAGYLNRDFDRSRAGIIMGRGNYLNRGQANLMQYGLVLDQTVQLIQQIFPELSDEKLDEVRASLKRSLPRFEPETIPGLVPNVVTGRVANRLNLMGPNYLVDAACASTLIAIDQGMKELHSGRCDLVLVGGVHAASPPAISMVFCQIGALTRGDLAPFGATAGGTLLGEGIGILALKRHNDAVRDGDRVYAVVKGVGISSDGQAKGLLAPRLEGEVLAIQHGYGSCGVDPATVGLIEAHGTGIPLGDQTELAALTQVFGDRQGNLPACAIGSVKSMIGHCLPAAGAAGVIKTALALYHKVLPKTLCDQPNPALPFATSRFYVNNATRPWIHGNKDIPRRAAVNSFGFGGINAHVILEEAAEEAVEAASLQWASEVVAICGDTREALLANIDTVLEVLGGPSLPRLCDLAYTLACLAPARERLVVVTTSTDDLAAKLTRARLALENPDRHRMQARSGLFFDDAPQAQGQTAFLFPGEGAQYTNMLSDLCVAFPSVRRWFDRLDEAFLNEHDTPPSSIIFPAPTGLSPEQRQAVEKRLFDMDLGSEVISISNLALTELLRQLGVPCDVMLGHSTGEFAALVASGIFHELGEAEALLPKMRELHFQHQKLERDGSIVTGTLLAVGALEHDRISQELSEAGEGVFLAMDNCRNQAVLFAPTDKADALKVRLKSHGAIVLSLPFDRAYHTPLFESVAASVRGFFDTVDVKPARTPLYSCSTTEVFPDDTMGIRDTAAQQFSTRVRFRETVLKMSDRGVRTFIEVGPRDNLTAFVKDILHERDHVALASNVQRLPALRQIQHLLAELFVRGTMQDLTPLFAKRACENLDVSLTRKTVNKGIRLNIELPIMTMTAPWPLKQRPLEQLKTRAPTVKEDLKMVELQLLSSAPVVSNDPYAASVPVKPAVPPQAPAVTQTVATPTVTDPRLVALQGHFNIMNEFMAQQARTMQSIAGGARVTETPQEPASMMFSERYPLLGELVSQQPERLVAVRSYTVDQDLYLSDHTIGVGGPVSALQPHKRALPVVPLTFSMEAIAEAAHCLTGGHGRITGMRDIAGHRWIALERHRAVHLRITAEVESTLAPDSVVRVQIEEVQNPQDTSGKLTFEGRVEVATAYPFASGPMLFSGAPLVASSTADADLYRGSMFHGPRLRGVTHIRGLSEDRIEADMVTLAVDDLFAFTRMPQFQVDPALLDACGQLLGYWSFENVHPAANLFPVQIKRLQLFAPPPPVGASLIGRAAIRREQSGQTLEANVEIADLEGRPLLQLSGWCDRIFSDATAHHFLDWRLDPARSHLSEPRLESESVVFARGMTPARSACLRGAGGIWFKTAAHIVLTPAEREIWYALPESGPQREEWLLGYITAKDVARQWTLEKHNIELAPIDIEIRTNAEGKPFIYSDFAGGITFPKLSITYSKGHTVACIACEPGGLADKDLERFAWEVIQQQCGFELPKQRLSGLPAAEGAGRSNAIAGQLRGID